MKWDFRLGKWGPRTVLYTYRYPRRGVRTWEFSHRTPTGGGRQFSLWTPRSYWGLWILTIIED